MSTYWYFQCLDHDPPVMSPEEFTQHTEDVYFWDAIKMASQRPLSGGFREPVGDSYFAGNARAFLIEHPQCRLSLVNEYGEHRPLDTTKLEMIERRIQLLVTEIEQLQAQAEALRS